MRIAMYVGISTPHDDLAGEEPESEAVTVLFPTSIEAEEALSELVRKDGYWLVVATVYLEATI